MVRKTRLTTIYILPSLWHIWRFTVTQVFSLWKSYYFDVDSTTLCLTQKWNSFPNWHIFHFTVFFLFQKISRLKFTVSYLRGFNKKLPWTLLTPGSEPNPSLMAGSARTCQFIRFPFWSLISILLYIILSWTRVTSLYVNLEYEQLKRKRILFQLCGYLTPRAFKVSWNHFTSFSGWSFFRANDVPYLRML